MKKRQIIEGVLGVVVLGIAVGWLSGWFEPKIKPGVLDPSGQTVVEGAQLYTVMPSTSLVHEWSSGSVASARQTAVASRVLARVEAVLVRAGTEVRRGDELIRLDARDMQSRVDQASEALKGAKARFELATAEMDRAAELLATGTGTKRRVDEATSQLLVAKSEMQRLTNSLSEAQTALSHTRILAPVNGRVIDRLVEPGETASPGRVLLRLYDPSVLRVEAPVRERLAVKLKVGDELDVHIPSIDCHCAGVIDEIVPFAETGARTMMIKVRLPQNPDILAGMFSRVAIPAGPRTRLLVPANAITRIGQLEYVMVVEDGVMHRQMVTTGRSERLEVLEVLSGLSGGEVVALPNPS